MFIRRCAWHPRYRGRRLIYGIASWRGRGIRFTDGVCRGCAAELRRSMGLDDPFPPTRSRLTSALAPAAVAVIAVTGLVFAGPQRVHELPPPPPAVGAPARPGPQVEPLHVHQPPAPPSIPARRARAAGPRNRGAGSGAGLVPEFLLPPDAEVRSGPTGSGLRHRAPNPGFQTP